MKKFVLLVMLVTIALVGCKRKEHVQLPAPPPAVSAPALLAPSAAVPPAPTVAVPSKPEPTPGSFAAKKASGPVAEEKPASFAKKVAKPKPAVTNTDAKEESGVKKSFAKKKVQ